MRRRFFKGSLCSFIIVLLAFCTIKTSYSQTLVASGFENATPPLPPPGWIVSHTGNANWQSLKNFMGSGNALKGQKCMYLASSFYGDQSDAWLYTPKFHLEAGKKYSFSFYYKNQVNGSNTMQVTLGNDTFPASQTEVVWDKKFSNIYYEKGQINYTATETTDKVLAFHCITPRTYVYIYIDEVYIKEVSCFTLLNIGVKNITTSSAEFSWDAVEGTAGYIYGISDTLVPPSRLKKTASNKITISGLKSSKQYYLYVRSACSETQGSEWAIKEFATAYDASTFESIGCGTVVANNFFRATEGLYKDAYCGTIYGGREFFHKFTPSVSGYYNFDVLAVNTGQYMKFLYKESNGGADPDPGKWTCIIQEVGDFGGKARFGPLEAGKEYIIMEKARAAVGLPSSYSYAIECYTDPPSNDSCSNPLEFTPVAFNDTSKGSVISTIGATSSHYLKVNYNECGAFDGAISDDEVWIKFTANSDQQLFRISDTRYYNLLYRQSEPGIYFNIFRDPCDLKSLVDCGYIEVSRNVTKEFYSYKLAKGKTYYCRIFSADLFTYAKFRLSIMPLDISKGAPNLCTPFYSYTIDEYTDRDNRDEWVPFTDANYKLIAFVKAMGHTLDIVNGGLYVNEGTLRQDAKGVYYLDRNITISPSTQPAGTVRVRILISNDELDRLIAQPGSGVGSIKDIRVTRNTDNCVAAFNSEATAFIKPYTARDFDEHNKMIEFETNNLSSFYLHGGNEALSLSGTPVFAASAGSDIRTGSLEDKLSVYPNPVKNSFNIVFTEIKECKYTVTITDMQGKVIKSITQRAIAGSNQCTVDATAIPAGVYFIKVESPGNIQHARIIKQ